MWAEAASPAEVNREPTCACFSALRAVRRLPKLASVVCRSAGFNHFRSCRDCAPKSKTDTVRDAESSLFFRSSASSTSSSCRARDLRKSAKRWPVGWEALEQWGDDVARIEPLAGGVANDVWSVRVNGHLAVGRLGARSDADLAWETELLQHLDREGLTVPVPIPTTDGRLFADGLVVMTYVEGGPPETEADWRRVADTLRQLHRLTQGWPQRPGWRSSTDLLHAETGTRIDLGAMPREGVVRCRAAWARLVGRRTCVVHGDINPGNVRMTAGRVALIDWDESHVDVPDLDLVLPHNAAGLDDGAHDIAEQASAAWEAAVCWDDEYSVKRLAEVRPV